MREPLNHAAQAAWPSSLVAPASANGVGGADASALDALARRLQASQVDTALASSPQYLLFECAGINCTLPLAQLREVLSDVPRAISLPNSPDWLLGIFPNRSEMLALVDPLPALQGQLADGIAMRDAGAAGLSSPPVSALSERTRASVLMVGAGERSLGVLVDTYGDTAIIQLDELDTTPAAIAAAGPPIVPRYIAAIYRPSDANRRYLVLDADHLVADLIAALQEADEVYG